MNSSMREDAQVDEPPSLFRVLALIMVSAPQGIVLAADSRKRRA